jgi:serine/threonine-protein kinase HipA
VIHAAEIWLWDRLVGTVALEEDARAARFEYDRGFLGDGFDLAPLEMPLRPEVYYFPGLSLQSFHGLPGMLADSLPDKFGNAVLRAWVLSRGGKPEELTPIDRLCYTGTRGMGALEFRPALFRGGDEAEAVRVDDLARLAAEVLRQRTAARAELRPGLVDFAPILKVGSSAGGARAKALIGWNEETGEVRSGQTRLPEGFGYWLLKFDGLDGNGDKEESDRSGYGRVEYAYHLMARAAGIEMSECRLWDGCHFMTRRFDRLPGGGKLHMQSLAALAHLDFNDPTANSYEQAFRVARAVTADARAEAQLFLRMCFNVLAWNCDDHVKNVAFLMDRAGTWSLAPAFDATYAYNPEGVWTGAHQMSVNGKRRGIGDDDLLAASRVAGLKPHRAKEALERVRSAVARWPNFAGEAGVRPDFAEEIAWQLQTPRPA